MKNFEKAHDQYKDICEQMVGIFAEKQDIEFEFWIGDKVGGQAVFVGGEYQFNLSDIVLDLETNQPKGLILQWHNETLDRYFKKKQVMNYNAFSKGLTYLQLDNNNEQ